MKRLALVLVAACGGGSATQTTTTPTTPGASGASGDEDWRGYLGQLAGTPCKWVPGASFLACTTDAGTTLVGWEATNRRYVAWRIAGGKLDVLGGTASNAGWTFEGPAGRIALTRIDAKAWTATGLGASDITLTIDPAATPGSVAPGNLPATEDWRNELHARVGEWTFSGTVGGAHTSFVQRCEWVPTSTFIFCASPADPAEWSLVGWEPHNRRYVQIGITDDGAPEVLPATVANKNWTYADATMRVTLTRKSALEYELRAEMGGTVLVEGTLSTKPGAVE